MAILTCSILLAIAVAGVVLRDVLLDHGAVVRHVERNAPVDAVVSNLDGLADLP